MSAQPHRTVETPRDGLGRTPRLVRCAGLALAATLVTAGCAAGQVASTAEQKPSLDGTNASVGTMDLRAIAIATPPEGQSSYRAGTSAQLKVVLVNGARTADRLTGISTSAASGWAYYADYRQAYQRQQADAAQVTGTPTPAESTSAEPSGSEAASSSESASESASGSASSSETQSSSESASSSESTSESTSESQSSSESGSQSSEPSASPSSSQPPQGTTSITIPALGSVASGTPVATGAILLTGISKDLYPATTVNITFTFARAGTVTVAVPVQLATLGRDAVVPGGEGEGGE